MDKVATTIRIRNSSITAKALRKSLVSTSPSISPKETYKHIRTTIVALVTTVGSMRTARASEAHRSSRDVAVARCSPRF